jgi:hypothetical protein
MAIAGNVRGRRRMKNKTKKPRTKNMEEETETVHDDLFERCIKKGLIEKTPYGYYFTPEFFETLEMYDDDE